MSGNVYVSDLIVTKRNRNGRASSSNNSSIGGSMSSGSTGSAPIPKITIPFTASALPTIADYQTVYAAIHGNQPTVILIIITAAGRYQSPQQPNFTLLTNTGSPDDLINTIYFDLGNPETGFIILQ